MRLPAFTFRILFPSAYLISTILPMVGVVLTIAEGPNPFGFLFFASVPGLYFLDLIDRVLPIPPMNIWITLLLGFLVNIGIYFVAGYLVDYVIKRRRHKVVP